MIIFHTYSILKSQEKGNQQCPGRRKISDTARAYVANKSKHSVYEGKDIRKTDARVRYTQRVIKENANALGVTIRVR